MRSTGIVRRIDNLGRIVIPKEIRRSLGLKDQTTTEEGTALKIYTDGDSLILKKYAPGCVCCGEVSNTTKVEGILLCSSCMRKIAAASNQANKINI